MIDAMIEAAREANRPHGHIIQDSTRVCITCGRTKKQIIAQDIRDCRVVIERALPVLPWGDR